MDNYQRALDYARGLFLQWDQAAIIARCRLRHDEERIYLNFLGEPWCIERASGIARCIVRDMQPADFSQALSIYDYLCRREPLGMLTGNYIPANALRHTAQSSPDTGSYHRSAADRLQMHVPALKQALLQCGIAPFPQGDAACFFPVFDGFNAVFQFWEGDEEFPPSVRFLWDENTPDRLKYETLYYIMGSFLKRLEAQIGQIEKNVK